MASMNYFDSDMSNRTNTVVQFDGKDGNLYLCLRARSHIIYLPQGGCSIFQPAKFKQTITRQHVLLRRETLIDGRAVTIILCLHVLIAHSIFLIFGYVEYFQLCRCLKRWQKCVNNFIL